jgi:iron-sulfur cluster insertion protein
MITITPSAKAQIETLLLEEPGMNLRTFVQGGGCSGFQYGFTFDSEQGTDDFVVDMGSFKILVDAMSMQYLEDAEIDFKDDLNGSSFTIKNPNAVSTCGCGSSFSV